MRIPEDFELFLVVRLVLQHGYYQKLLLSLAPVFSCKHLLHQDFRLLEIPA